MENSPSFGRLTIKIMELFYIARRRDRRQALLSKQSMVNSLLGFAQRVGSEMARLLVQKPAVVLVPIRVFERRYPNKFAD